MVNLMDFNPDRVVVLDWYRVVLDLFPDVDVTDRKLCEEKLNFIVRFIEFVPYHRSQTFYVYWLTPQLRENAKNDPDFLSVKKKFTKYCDLLLSLNWLLPSGIILNNMKNVGLMSSFFYNNHLYASFADGCVVLLEPKLHDDFLFQYTDGANEGSADGLGDKSFDDENLEYLQIDQ